MVVHVVADPGTNPVLGTYQSGVRVIYGSCSELLVNCWPLSERATHYTVYTMRFRLFNHVFVLGTVVPCFEDLALMRSKIQVPGLTL